MKCDHELTTEAHPVDEKQCIRCGDSQPRIEVEELRAEVRDLKARLKAQAPHVGRCSGCDDAACKPCRQRRARNLRVRKWREP